MATAARSRRGSKARPATKVQAPLHRDAYPIDRISTEFFLRSFEFVVGLHDDIISCQIIMALWHDALTGIEQGNRMGIRQLSRRLDLPYETVRRHVQELVRGGFCVVESGEVGIAARMLTSPRMSEALRKIYVQAARMLSDLTRIEVIGYKPRPSTSRSKQQLNKEQSVVAAAGLQALLAAMKLLRAVFGGDLTTGLVFNAIRAANIKHITNSAPAANRGILPDSDRRPISVLAISESMRLPYETVRRHAGKLVREGKCIRVGRRGLITPESTFRQFTAEANTIRQLVLDFLGRVKAEGVRI